MIRRALVCITFLLCSAPVPADIDKRPRTLATFHDMPKVVARPDGTLVAFLHPITGPMCAVTTRFSADGGRTWSDLKTLFTLPEAAGGFGYTEVFCDRNGELHIFLLCDNNTGAIKPLPGNVRAGRDQLDIWHARTTDGGKKWLPPRPIWKGRAGDMQSIIQLKSGRILLPISYRVNRSWRNRGEGFEAFTYMGPYRCSALYSDDGGATWQRSSSVLMTPVPALSAIGGVEPVVIELKDGRIWMLIRTQLGRFYESFSKDGTEWTPARPTSILSSESPAGLIRLQDGRILLLWNNCHRFPYAYGGRHVLHAAISDDEGRTWRGYREALRDRFAENPLPSNHDVGVSYPYPLLTKDGKVLFTLWVDTSRTDRSLTLLDPAWLDETVQKDDFSGGLEQWSVFGTKGVELATHPEKSGAKVLQIRKTHFDWPAAAVWNFPAGAKGRVRLKIHVKPGFAGAFLGLTDHFSVPFDMEDRFYNLFNLEIGSDGKLPGGKRLEPGRWHHLQFDWDCDKRECRVSVDGQRAATLPLTRLTTAGVNYLRLRSTAVKTDSAGMLVEYVKADVSKSWPARQPRVTAPVHEERGRLACIGPVLDEAKCTWAGNACHTLETWHKAW